jgi:GNAT superfamily N-acetyltransferase
MHNDYFLALASQDDCPKLLAMMQDFYIEDAVAFNDNVMPALLRELLETPEYGRVYLVQQQQSTLGYAILTWRFCLEYGGKVAHLDELYLLPPARGQGVGRLLIGALCTECAAHGASTLLLDTVMQNAGAREFYRKLQFEDSARTLQYRHLVSR